MEEASLSSKHVQAPTRPWRSRVSDPAPVIFTKVKANQKTSASTGLPSPKPARPSQLSWVSRAPSQGYLYGYKLLVPDAYKLEMLNQPLHSTKCNQSCLHRESFSAHELGLLIKTKPSQLQETEDQNSFGFKTPPETAGWSSEEIGTESTLEFTGISPILEGSNTTLFGNLSSPKPGRRVILRAAGAGAAAVPGVQ